MEEKKNNKGLVIGIIVFLILVLGVSIIFIYKMIYIENVNTTPTERNNKETMETNEGVFTELTKYELQEGEEKEIKGNKIKLENYKYYFNEQEIEKSIVGIYSTQNLIIFAYSSGQYGGKYIFYDLEGNEKYINYENGDKDQYWGIRLKNNRIFVDYVYKESEEEKNLIGNLQVVVCSLENAKEITTYLDVLNEHKNDEKNITYEIKYNNGNVIIEKAQDINTIEKWIDTFDKVCVIENNK
ncbi:MAG: hypothetical protein IJ068_07635 [Bacilli bacterium]|nr:hypothetical protein [Bacilli bacterium]